MDYRIRSQHSWNLQKPYLAQTKTDKKLQHERHVGGIKKNMRSQ